MDQEKTTLDELDENHEGKEQFYQSRVNVFASMSCMTVTKSKIDMYKQLEKDFNELGDYQDSEKYAKKCTEQLKKIRRELKQNQYEKCCKKYENAKTEKDYQEVRAQFRKLKEYKDSAELVVKCDIILNNKAKKNKLGLIRKMCFAVVIIMIILLSQTRFGQYNIARVYNKLSFYGKAAEVYQDLGSYKDCKSRYKESAYHQAKHLQEDGKLKEAQKIFYKINEYKDSAKYLVEVESALVDKTKIGDVVTLGATSWIVLDKQDNQTLCMKKKSINDQLYATEDSNVTWESSQMRNFLNGEFIAETFCEEERAHIVTTKVVTSDNSKYATKGGNATQDQIFLLSIEEVTRYENILMNYIKKASWLRSPGAIQSAVSVYNGKMVSNYGRLATDENVIAYPAFWYAVQ
jgi:tetratricopeptide (TPR) repeat protein